MALDFNMNTRSISLYGGEIHVDRHALFHRKTERIINISHERNSPISAQGSFTRVASCSDSRWLSAELFDACDGRWRINWQCGMVSPFAKDGCTEFRGGQEHEAQWPGWGSQTTSWSYMKMKSTDCSLFLLSLDRLFQAYSVHVHFDLSAAAVK